MLYWFWHGHLGVERLVGMVWLVGFNWITSCRWLCDSPALGLCSVEAARPVCKGLREYCRGFVYGNGRGFQGPSLKGALVMRSGAGGSGFRSGKTLQRPLQTSLRGRFRP